MPDRARRTAPASGSMLPSTTAAGPEADVRRSTMSVEIRAWPEATSRRTSIRRPSGGATSISRDQMPTGRGAVPVKHQLLPMSPNWRSRLSPTLTRLV